MTTSIMLTATQARAKAKNDLVIFNETRNIESAILTAIVDSAYQVIVSNTTMTSTATDNIVKARQYFNSWQGVIPDRSLDIQMASIISYFTNLGYGIERRTNPNNGDTFVWLVQW